MRASILFKIILMVLAFSISALCLFACDFTGGSTSGGNTGGETEEEEEKKEEEEEQSLTWEERWSALDGKLDADAIDAIRGLYEFYDDSVYEWLANLWSCEVGGFYYSNSARDYEGFLPDLESTRQVLAIIRTSGMMRDYGEDNDKAFVSALPADIRNKIVSFVKSCQSPDDGYFYHPQWESVGSSRRSRDLDWAIEILNLFGEKPSYPTALDRLSGTAGVQPSKHSTVVAVSKIIAAASTGLPDYLKSEAAFIAYLDTFDFASNSHDTGHVVGTQISQIKAAGLIDVCCDYFDEKQQEIYDLQVANGEKPSGLWQTEVNYTSLSGLYKIGGIYASAGRSMNYLNECVDSAIQCIKSTNQDVSVIIYVLNPLAGLQKAITCMKMAVENGDTRYNLESTYAKIRTECAELVDVTVNKLAVFRKSTGGFSYNPYNSAPITQGTTASLGVEEGDVNATNIAVNSISNMIFSCMGMNRIPIWNGEDFERWLGIIESFESDAPKKPVESLELDFEDDDEGYIPMGITAVAPSGVVEDGGNMAFCFYDATDVGTKSYINTGISGEFDCAAFEMDVKFKSYSGNATTHQIKFRGSLGNMYMLTFKISGKNLIISDSSHTGGGIGGSLNITVPNKEWTKLRFEFYTGVDSEISESGFIVKIFVNDEFAAVSTNFFGPTTQNPTGHTPNIGISQLEVYGMGAAGSELLVDNIKAELLTGQKYSED